MKQALLIGLALMHGGAAEAQGVKENVMMHVRANFVPSTTGCSLFSFVAAPPSSQPEASATLCAIGGPFGPGMVGTVLGPFPSFAGITIHVLDRIVSFNATDAIFLRLTFLTEAGIDAGTGGVDYLSGNWKITGGTGVFSGLSGQGTAGEHVRLQHRRASPARLRAGGASWMGHSIARALHSKHGMDI
jgi:hypothetical protein